MSFVDRNKGERRSKLIRFMSESLYFAIRSRICFRLFFHFNPFFDLFLDIS